MAYTLSEHARDVMAKRAIRTEWLERALCAPEWCESDRIDNTLEHRLVTIHEFGNRVLRVIVNTQVKPVRVVTAYFDRRMRGA